MIVGTLVGQTSCDQVLLPPLPAVCPGQFNQLLWASVSTSDRGLAASSRQGPVSLNIPDEGQGLRPGCLEPWCPPSTGGVIFQGRQVCLVMGIRAHLTQAPRGCSCPSLHPPPSALHPQPGALQQEGQVGARHFPLTRSERTFSDTGPASLTHPCPWQP